MVQHSLKVSVQNRLHRTSTDMPFCAMPFYGAYFRGAPGRIPIGPAPIIAWLTNPPLSMAHQLMCTTEISLSEISLYVAHQLMCAT
jgi:hypothetical protein